MLDSYILAEAAQEANLPAGVVNWVPAEREVGACLVAHLGVDKVAFTGSTAAGRASAGSAASYCGRYRLELGGKSAAIILDDADLDIDLDGLKFASLMNNGQACVAQTRVLAAESRYDEVVEALARKCGAAGRRSGGPRHRGRPAGRRRQRDRVESYIASGRRRAKTGRLGGGRPGGPRKGLVRRADCVRRRGQRHAIAQEEIFGPVLAVIPYEDEDEAVRIANDSDYGLGPAFRVIQAL